MINFDAYKPDPNRYIISGKPQDVELVNHFINYQTDYYKKLTGVKAHLEYDYIPYNKLITNMAETIHCTNEDAAVLYDYVIEEKNFRRLIKNNRPHLDKEAEVLHRKHINKHSDEFLDSYIQTVEKIKTRAKKYAQEIDALFPDKTPTKKLDAREVLIAIKESRFNYRTGNISKHPNIFLKLASKKYLKQALTFFLAKHAHEINPDKYLDYFIDQKGYLKWYNVLSRKIIRFLKNL